MFTTLANVAIAAEDDGAALRLAVALRLHIDHHNSDVTVWICNEAGATPFTEDGTSPDATRRAISRAANALSGRS